MKIMNFCAAVGIAGLLAACAQQEEPMLVKPEPVYNKFGDAGCEDAWIYIPGSVPERDECVPEDECEPVYDTAGNIIYCPPPPRYPDAGGSDSGGRSPTGSTSPTGSAAGTAGTT